MGANVVSLSGIRLDSFQENLADRVIEQLNEYGQSALEIMTSGGKSYIAARIIERYIGNDQSENVLWLAPKSAIINVRDKIFSKMSFRDNIKYIGYEEISRGNINIAEIYDIKLIVFDECHKAYAHKTFENINSLLSLLGDCDRLAMSATPVRYNGDDTFNILVPRAADNAIRFDLQEASAHNLLPTVVYVLANLSISSSDLNAINKYEKFAKRDESAYKLFTDIKEMIDGFNFDMKKDLSSLLVENINSSGESGERHIAFFSSIAEIKEKRDDIEKAFILAYPNCTINVVEYHSGMTNEENNEAFRMFVVEDPEPYRIDVMLSVDKATESIHPDNIRSVLMFRGTQSIRVYLQQMGRGVMLKSYHPEDIVIFDFADNVDCVGDNPFLYDKQSSVSSAGSIAGIRKAIMQEFGYSSGIVTRIGLSRIRDSLAKLDEIYKFSRLNATINNIKSIMNIHDKMVAKNLCDKTENIYLMIFEYITSVTIGQISLNKNKYGTLERFETHWESVKNYFSNYQKMYLNGEGENSGLVEFFESLGHSAYLMPTNSNKTEKLLSDIDYVSNELKKVGYDSEKLQNTHAIHRLKQLRLAYSNNDISETVYKYAMYKLVTIDVYHVTLNDLLQMAYIDSDKETIQSFKALDRFIESAVNKSDKLDFETWLKIVTKLRVAYKQNKDDKTTSICYNILLNKYDAVISEYTLIDDNIENGNILIEVLNKLRKGIETSDLDDNFIFKHSRLMDYSAYEQEIFREFGVTKTNYKSRAEYSTTWYKNYTNALNGDIEAIQRIVNSKKVLNDYRKRIIGQKQFKELLKEKADDQELMSNILLRKAKTLTGTSDETRATRKELAEALTNGIIDSIDLVVAPFTSYVTDMAYEVFEMVDEEFIESLENIGSKTYKLALSCMQPSSCSIDIMKNILKIQNIDLAYKQRLNELYKFIIKNYNKK